MILEGVPIDTMSNLEVPLQTATAAATAAASAAAVGDAAAPNHIAAMTDAMLFHSHMTWMINLHIGCASSSQ